MRSYAERVLVSAVRLLGCFAPMKSNQLKASDVIVMILLGVPVLYIIYGGVYSLPAMRVTKERDPWLTLLLAGGLAITVFGIGVPTHTPPLYLGALWLGSIVLLMFRRASCGSLGHNLERFGLVHAATLLATMLLIMLRHHVTRSEA